MYGVFALLDHQTAALSTIADAVAALSCDALKADVTAFNLMDSGDGYTAKDEIAKLVHSKTRVELNSAVKAGKGGPGSVAGAAGMVRTALLPLAAALWDLGTCSFDRSKSNLYSMGSDDLRSSLGGLFEKKCPSNDSLKNEFKLFSELVFEGEENYGKLAHQVNVLLGLVWKVVAWEAIIAYVSLEGAELNESKSTEVNGEEKAKVDKKSEKKRKVEEKGLTIEAADKIGDFVKERGSPLELLSKLKSEGSEFLDNNASVDALNDLEILFKALDKSKCIDKVTFDLSLARGLDYYTGVIYEAVFKGGAQVGSIAAGGRYDNLIGMFGTKQVPAVGVSLGIERVFNIMEQIQKDQNQTTRATKTEVLVSILGDDLIQAAELASELWDAKIKAEYLVAKRPDKHFRHAEESKIPWMLMVGERQVKEGTVRLKDVESKAEDVIQRGSVVEELRRRLSP
uniref:histidine--tRNA ligase n=1 Tax=Cannabis sativa TaxID=3483 RepID=A0A803QMU1_CANSA